MTNDVAMLGGRAFSVADSNLVKVLLAYFDDARNLEGFLAAYPSVSRAQLTHLLALAKNCPCSRS